MSFEDEDGAPLGISASCEGGRAGQIEQIEQIAASSLLIRTAALLRSHMEARLAPEGLDMLGYCALVVIARHQRQPLRPSQLSVLLEATRTQVTRLLDALEAAALVERLPSSEDRRARALKLTAAGEQKLKRSTPPIHALYARAWAVAADLESTVQQLRALERHLRALPEALAPSA